MKQLIFIADTLNHTTGLKEQIILWEEEELLEFLMLEDALAGTPSSFTLLGVTFSDYVTYKIALTRLN